MCELDPTAPVPQHREGWSRTTTEPDAAPRSAHKPSGGQANVSDATLHQKGALRKGRMPRSICPMHASEDYDGEWISDEVGWSYTCTLTDHPIPGPYTWCVVPEPPGMNDLSGIAADLGLEVSLPNALKQFSGRWVEYGVLEHAWALENPAEWMFLLERYSHTAVAAKRYTVSAFLGGVLGRLWRRGTVAGVMGPATGRWAYNRRCGYYALPPGPDSDIRLTWEESCLTVEYVPGQTELD